MKDVYVLQHDHILVDNQIEFDEVKFIGVFSSAEKAEEAIDNLMSVQGFNSLPRECFFIDKYSLDDI